MSIEPLERPGTWITATENATAFGHHNSTNAVHITTSHTEVGAAGAAGKTNSLPWHATLRPLSTSTVCHATLRPQSTTLTGTAPQNAHDTNLPLLVKHFLFHATRTTINASKGRHPLGRLPIQTHKQLRKEPVAPPKEVTATSVHLSSQSTGRAIAGAAGNSNPQATAKKKRWRHRNIGRATAGAAGREPLGRPATAGAAGSF